jgi:hypothetical protein
MTAIIIQALWVTGWPIRRVAAPSKDKSENKSKMPSC